jgi:hypothetical protein
MIPTIIGILIANAGTAQSDLARVERTIERTIDVTGDGVPDRIVLKISADTWQTPIKWSLSILSKGKVVYSYFSDDTWLDKFFNDRDFMNKTCTGYLDCKKKYYLTDLMKGVAEIDFRPPDPDSRFFDKVRAGSIYNTAGKELIEKYHFTESEAFQTVDLMVSKIKAGKAILINIPVSPVQVQFPRMYCDKVGAFLVIYEW